MIASGFRLDDQPSGTGVCRFALSGELDAHTAQRLVTEVERGLADGTQAVHLAMDHLEFIDSAGLRALVELDRRLRADERRLVLEHPTDAVRHVLRIADLADHFEIVA